MAVLAWDLPLQNGYPLFEQCLQDVQAGEWTDQNQQFNITMRQTGLADGRGPASVRTKSGGLLAVLAVSALGTMQALAGNVFVSGHDSDFHAQAGNTLGAQHIIQQGLNFTRNGNNEAILFIQSNTLNLGLGDHLDSELGLIASGYMAGSTPGNHYVKVSASEFLTADLSLYSSIFVPSDHGGTLTGDDLVALNSRQADIFDYVNSGGGLFALAEDGFRTPATSNPQPANFAFLPFLATSAPLGEFESGNTLTPYGVSLGLTTSDINGNYSHNVFLTTGGMNIVDIDAGGEILSLATSQRIGPGGVPDAGTTFTLLVMALGMLPFCRNKA